MSPLLPPARLMHHALWLSDRAPTEARAPLRLLEDLALDGVPVVALDLHGHLTALGAPRAAQPPLGPAPGAGNRAHGGSATQPGDLLAPVDAAARGPEVRLFTPGLESGAPVDVLSALTCAPCDLAADPEALVEFVHGAVVALLTWIGARADPRSDPEAILLSRLLHAGLRDGDALPLERLIPQFVEPPFQQVGCFHVDALVPREDRLQLARRLNASLASPAAAALGRGSALDLDEWLALAPSGHPRLNILSLSHLDDIDRTLVAAIVLHHLVGWCRRQVGAVTPRAALAVDDVGLLAPRAPRGEPTRAPLLALLRQGGPVGMSLVLAARSASALDPEVLTGVGTWLLGRVGRRADRDLLARTASDRPTWPAVDLRPLAALPDHACLIVDETGARRHTVPQTHSAVRPPPSRVELAALAASGRDHGASLTRRPPPLPAELTARWLVPDAAATSIGHAETVWQPVPYLRMATAASGAGGGTATEGRVEHRPLLPDADSTNPRDAADTALDEAWLSEAPPPYGRYAPLPDWLANPSTLRAIRERHLSALRPPNDAARPQEATATLGLLVVWVPT